MIFYYERVKFLSRKDRDSGNGMTEYSQVRAWKAATAGGLIFKLLWPDLEGR